MRITNGRAGTTSMEGGDDQIKGAENRKGTSPHGEVLSHPFSRFDGGDLLFGALGPEGKNDGSLGGTWSRQKTREGRKRMKKKSEALSRGISPAISLPKDPRRLLSDRRFIFCELVRAASFHRQTATLSHEDRGARLLFDWSRRNPHASRSTNAKTRDRAPSRWADALSGARAILAWLRGSARHSLTPCRR